MIRDIPHYVKVGEYYEVPKYYHKYVRNPKPPWEDRFWNRPEGTVLGHTGKEWLMILFAFLLFYMVLICFTTICWYVYYSTVSLGAPRSLMGQPGFIFEPICELLDKYHIHYSEKSKTEIDCYTNKIEEFFEKHGKHSGFGNCVKNSNFGYAFRMPCLFLKINRCIGFKVDAYGPDDLPDSMPQELQTFIKALPAGHSKNFLWISCEPDHKLVRINYYPWPGLAAEDLMHKSKSTITDRNFARIVAIELTNMPINKEVKVKCSAWAKNVNRGGSSFLQPGTASLQIYIRIQN